MQDGVSELSSSVKSKSCIGIVEENGKQIVGSASVINEKFAAVLLSILVNIFLTDDDIIIFSLTWLTMIFSSSWLDNTEAAGFIC